MPTSINIYIYICIYWINKCIYVYTCTHVYTCVYMCIYWINKYIYMQINTCVQSSCINYEAKLEKLERWSVQPSERLACLGIMGEQLRAPLKPIEHHGTIVSRRVKGSYNRFDYIYMYIIYISTFSDCRCTYFSSLNWHKPSS